MCTRPIGEFSKTDSTHRDSTSNAGTIEGLPRVGIGAEATRGEIFGGQNDPATRQMQLGRLFAALASMLSRRLTSRANSYLMVVMFRKKSPRLAAAFVVTISAGCGGATPPPENGTNGTSTTDATPDGTTGTNEPKKPDGATDTTEPKKPDGPENQDWVPNIGSVKGGLEKGADGKCVIVHPANPPWREPVDCETQEPLKKPEVVDPKPADPKPPATGLTPIKPDDTNWPEAPAGWTVKQNSDGSCRAFAPAPKCRPGMRCNPPPPQNVKCPPNMPKEKADPTEL